VRAFLLALVLCALCAAPAAATTTLAYDPLEDDILATADGHFPDPDTAAVLARFGASGALDPAFGLEGRTWTAGRRLVRQPDGGLVTYTTDTAPGRLQRFHPDGTLDVSFGDAGELAIEIGIGAAVALANGDILLADSAGEGVRVRRIDRDGHGVPALVAHAPGQQFVTAVHPTPEGIVVAGSGFLMRFADDGKLDERFGDHGIVAPIAGGPSAVSGAGIVVLDTGPGPVYVLRRYRADGTRDPDWGDGGERRLDFVPRNPLGPISGLALAAAPGGAVLAATTIADGGVAVTRVTADGDVDPDYGSGGSTVLHIDDDGGVSDLLALPDGGAALAYLTTDPPAFDHRPAIARLTPTGLPDPGFGAGGVAQPALVVDGPPVTIDTAQRAGTGATFTFSSPDPAATFRCRLTSSPLSRVRFEPCTSGIHYEALASGFQQFEVEAVDLHANVGPVATTDWTVPAGPPETSLTAAPPRYDRHALARFHIVADKPLRSLVCTLDGSQEFPCSQSQSVGVRDGEHVFTARATDTGGETDPTPVEHRWTVDTKAPATVLDSAPAAVTTDTDGTFAFSSPEAATGFECRLDGAAWTPCTSPARFTGLATGRHTLGLRAVDLAGNADASPLEYVWRIDPPVIPPPVLITEPPAPVPTALTVAVAPRAVQRAGGGRRVLERVQVHNPLARRGTVRLCARYPRGWRPRHRLCTDRTLGAGQSTTFALRGRPPKRPRSGELRLTIAFPGLASLRTGALWIARR
jgi:uncharacterized delta-60 repeat protein